MFSGRRLMFLILLICSLHAFVANAQSVQPLLDIPPFRMLQTNGQFFSAQDLKGSKPVAIIYFSPDCDHCLALMKELFKNITQFKNIEIVLITFRRLEEIKPFEAAYKTASYPNIKVGTEGNTFYLRNTLHIENTPFTAIYNKQRRLVNTFKYLTAPKVIVEQLAKVNRML